MKKKTVSLMIAIFVISGVVVADDLFPPDWRGDARTVTAEWDSWAPIDPVSNPDQWSFGTGQFAMDVPFAMLNPDGIDLLSTYEGRSDVLHLHEYGEGYLPGLGFHLPNFIGGDYKTVRVQVTYWPDEFGNDAWLSNDFFVLAGMDPLNPDNTLPGYGINDDPIAATWIDEQENGGWLTETYEFTITPNPAWEDIWFGFEEYPAYVDQVVIDTICIPEPATLLLLSLGGLALRKRKQQF
ncbi:MAG: hypothetical protein DRP56_07445 [Planctomycetota bacterium]|nr:MAG: hypothetical protein DRP56_07445 [Planctomycetota bacterium]